MDINYNNDFKKEYQQAIGKKLAAGILDGSLDSPVNYEGNWAAAAHKYLLSNCVHNWANDKDCYEACLLLSDVKNELDYILTKANMNPCDLLANPDGTYIALRAASRYYFEELFNDLIDRRLNSGRIIF